MWSITHGGRGLRGVNVSWELHVHCKGRDQRHKKNICVQNPLGRLCRRGGYEAAVEFVQGSHNHEEGFLTSVLEGLVELDNINQMPEHFFLSLQECSSS